MNRNLQGAMYAFILFALILVGLIFLPPTYLPQVTGTPTATPDNTPTPTSTNTVFTAHINYDTPCLTGPGEDHEMVTTVAQGKDMMLIARDKEPAAWLLVRPAGLKDCWVDRKFVTSYDIPAVAIFPTPVPPTFTLVPTRTLPPTKTETASPTNTKVTVSPVASQTRRPGDPPNPTSLPSATRPLATLPTKTPATPPTHIGVTPPTKTPVTPPTHVGVTPPTNTPVPPSLTPDYQHKECNDGKDNDGDGYKDMADPQCQSKGDDSEGP